MKLNSALAVAFTLTISGLAGVTSAQSWPAKPIRLITPFPAGSTVDSMARTIAPPLGELLGQPVIVDNKAGAGGNVGVDAVAKAAADGYTFGIGTTGPMAINPHLMARMPFDALRDLAAVAQLASGPNVLVVHPSVPAKSLADLIALAKRDPGKLAYGSAGIGSTGHLAGELFKTRAGIDILHVPYKGNQEAMTDLLGGRTQIAFSGLAPLLGAIQSGKLRVLAVAGDKRLSAIPDVPTMAEADLRGAEVMPWYGVIAPAGTAPVIVVRMHDALAQVMSRPDIRARFLATGSEPKLESSQDFAKLIRDDSARWGEVIRKSNIKPE